jgi:hypothetical protein
MKVRKKAALILLAICLFGCIIIFSMCQKISDEDWARTESAFNLRQIYLAIDVYHEIYGRLPSRAIISKDGKPLLSWRVAILPFVENDSLYQQFHLEEPWDSPHNQALIEKIPKVYRDMLGHPAGITHFQLVAGPGTPFQKDGLTWNDFPDGRANTILIVDAADGVPWTKPADLQYNPDAPMSVIGSFHQKSIHFAG